MWHSNPAPQENESSEHLWPCSNYAIGHCGLHQVGRRFVDSWPKLHASYNKVCGGVKHKACSHICLQVWNVRTDIIIGIIREVMPAMSVRLFVLRRVCSNSLYAWHKSGRRRRPLQQQLSYALSSCMATLPIWDRLTTCWFTAKIKYWIQGQ